MIFRIPGLLILLLPGTSLTTLLPLSGISPGRKFLIGLTLSPVVAAAEFYILRLAGLSFSQTAYLLVAINALLLPALITQLRRIQLPSPKTLMIAASALAVPLSFLYIQFQSPHVRAYSGHAWMHADIAYAIANGELAPEDPELAGVGLAYPWIAHVYHAVLSSVLDSSPVFTYFWVNLFSLLLIYALIAAVTENLSGNVFSQIASVLWLSFGVNFCGQLLGLIFPSNDWMFGDYRYSPWLKKFFFFEQLSLGLGIFAALVFLASCTWPGTLTKARSVLVALLISGVGVIYPLLLPAACGLVGGTILSLLWERRVRPHQAFNQLLALLAAAAVGIAVALSYLSLILRDRAGPSIVEISWPSHMAAKSLRIVLVLAPLLAGVVVCWRECWTRRRSEAVVLLTGAAASIFLYVVFHLPNYDNEYKYVFPAAMCLAPFAALAHERLVRRLGRRAWIGGLVIAVLPVPFVVDMYKNWPWASRGAPRLESHGFNLRVADHGPLAAVCDAIARRTPASAVVVVENAELHLPTLTRRKLYVSPSQKTPRPGINLVSDYLLTAVKGYDARLVRSRQSVVRDLFRSTSAARRRWALGQVLGLGRPVVLILDNTKHFALIQWLDEEALGARLYSNGPLVVWLITSSP